MLGVSQKTVSRWERGVDLPKAQTQARLNALFGESASDELQALLLAVRNMSLPLAIVDGDGALLAWSRSYPKRPDAMPETEGCVSSS